MSVNTVEDVLYRVACTREGKKKFLNERDAFLAQFPLSQQERQLIEEFEVGKLRRLGVNPMLLVGFWMQAEQSRSIGGYMRRIAD